MRQFYAIPLLILLLLLIASCGTPKTDTVRAQFLAEHPNATVLSIGSGEGDSGNVYIHIKYRLPDSKAAMEDVWLYQDLGGKTWINTWRKSTGKVAYKE